MANRSIELTLKANVSGMVNGLKTAQTAASNAGREFENFTKTNEQAMNTAGSAFMKGGAVAVAGAGLAVKAAMDWESAWAGVMKTNDGTAQQTQALEEDLRALTGVLPATHTEIAAVAEAAGQLGVGIDDVAGFSKVMLDLGETTNLSADEAATALARFSNIMGTSFDDADRLGSTIVDLGNNFATTEAEIVTMSTRIAAVGTQMGMSESDVMGMATAMSSVGIEAEAGGTAISMTMKNIDSAVRDGGDSLNGWAEAAGVSAQEFAEAWRNDPAQAMVLLTEGLGATAAAGGDVNSMLEDLGVKGIRESDTMLRLAQSQGLLSDALGVGAEAWAKNTALTAEAEIRYESTEAKISMAWNQIKDAAITAGEAILPVVAGIAESIGDVAGWFADLPAPVTGAITALSGVAGVTALAGGAFLTLAPRVMDSVRAVQDLRTAAPKTTSVLGDLGKTAGIMAAAIGGLSILSAVHNHFLDGVPTIEEWGQALIDAKDNAESLNDIEFSPNDWSMGEDIDSLGAALDNINAGGLRGFGNSVNDAVKGLTGWRSQNHEVEDSVASLDKAMASAFGSGSLEEAAAGFRHAAEEGERVGISLETTAKSFPEYLDGLRAMATEQGYTYKEGELLEAALGNLPPALMDVKSAADDAAQQEELTGALEEVGVAADGTVESLFEYLDLLFETGLAEMSARDAQSAYQESIDAVGDSVDQIIADHGGLGAALNKSKSDFDLTTQAGRDANDAFQGLATAGMEAAASMAENGASQEEVQAQLEGTYDSLITAAGQFGITGEEADALARAVMGVPEGKDIETWMSDYARQKAEETTEAVTGIPSQATIDSWMSDAAFIEALATRAAVLGIPEEDVIASFMSSAAKDEADETTASVLGIPVGASISSWMSSNARDEAQSTDWWLDQIDGRYTTSTHKHTTIEERITNFKQTGRFWSTPSTGGPVRPGGYTGGKVGKDFGLPGYALGGRLPYTGLGRDQILGIGSNGVPTALVDDGEWVIRERQARKFNGVLDAINRDHPSVRHLAGYYNGGQVGREWSAMSAPAAAGPVSATVDSGVIANAVASAISGYQPVVKIGMREFIGEMKQDRAWKGVS